MAKVQHTNMTVTDEDGNVLEKPQANNNDPDTAYRWWKSDDDNMATQVAATIKFIHQHQTGRITQLNLATRLYGNSYNYNYGGSFFTRLQTTQTAAPSMRIGCNICWAIVETLTAKMAKNKVVPSFVTNGAEWGMQRKAEQLTKFIGGVFYGHDVHEKGVDAFRDAATWGDGILHICEQEDELYIERCMPHEFFVDPIESLTQPPRQLHRVKTVDRDVIIALFPDLEEEIMTASSITAKDLSGAGQSVADLVTITESWHLKSGKDARDGLHCICLGDKVLFKEEYTKDYFPFVFFHFSKRLLGFWAQGSVERVQNLQFEINKLMVLIQRSMYMGGSYKVLVEVGSKVVSQHVDNDVGTIIHYQGTPPQWIAPPMIQADIYPYVNELIAKAFQQEGVSQMEAQSKMPNTELSGKAILAYNNIADDRQMYTAQQFEQFFLEIAFQCIEVVKDIYARKKTYKAVFPDGKFLETIDWKDIKLEPEEYELKCYPTSSLADDMAGRLEEVQELSAAGMISPRTARKLLRMPDLEMADNLADSAENLLTKTIEDMLDGGKYTAPEPYMDLALGKQLVLEYLNYASFQNAPDDVLAKLMQFSSQIDDMLGLNQPPPMPAGIPGAPAQPPANPQATPTSPLIPNVNQGGMTQ